MLDKNRQSFLVQRWFANKRNIQWNLSYDDWLDIWQKSGKFHLRGKGKGKYCMARKGDTGPYEIGNIYITSNEQNNLDQSINQKSYFKRKPIKLIDQSGNVISFPSKGQVAKFFGKTNNHMPESLEKGKEYKGWKIC